MLHIVLFEPEIPPNTGNIIRLCANSGAQLHLIKPLGFTLDDSRLKRAGLDYHEFTTIALHDSIGDFLKNIIINRIFALSTKSKTLYTQANFQNNDALLFGPETRGLPATILQEFAEENILRVPMLKNSRSLNLSNTVAIVLYEALRQLEFVGFT